MKQLLLLAVVGLAFLSGVATAGFFGFGPLAFISYHVLVPTNVTVIPAYINLGNLTPGSSGTVTAKAEVSISMNGTYIIALIHTDELEHTFSVFNVTVSIGNETLILNLEQPMASVYLTPGTYEVTITINYVVSSSPKPPYVAYNQPFLIIYPKGIAHPEQQENEVPGPQWTNNNNNNVPWNNWNNSHGWSNNNNWWGNNQNWNGNWEGNDNDQD